MSIPLTPRQQSRFRIALAIAGVLFAAIIVGFVVFLPPSREAPLPDFIDRVAPLGTVPVGDTSPVVVAIDPGYTIELFVDQLQVPDAEIAVGPDGYEWAPAPDRRRSAWNAGIHTVAVRWKGASGEGEYRWSFEAG